MKIFSKLLLNFCIYYAKVINRIKTYFFLKSFKSAGKNLHFHFPYNHIQGLEYISIGNTCYIDKNFFLAAIDRHWDDRFSPEIKIGNNFYMQFNCQISAINKIIIGDNVIIGPRVIITDHSHGNITKEELSIHPVKRKLISKGPVIIGNNVWISAGVAILPNVTIGDNCIIGANSVVTKSFGKNSVIAGNPARLIRTL